MKSVLAIAHSNIALVKYWGKRVDVDPRLNLPAVGSLSMTLDGLWTQTKLQPTTGSDRFVLGGTVQTGSAAAKVWAHLDRLWAHGHGGARPACVVDSSNHFPTAAGLASSASGFAALTVAAASAFELRATPTELSRWARMGSGSAARSIFGGFVRLHRGERADGEDCYAEPISTGEPPWPLALVVVQTALGAKSVGSTEGMERSRTTAPYYGPWVETSAQDLADAEAAIQRRDLAALGAIVEHSCFKMHACMMASRPPIVYWKPPTLAVIARVGELREAGVPGYVTIDAGPHVKVLCEPDRAAAIAQACEDVPGVEAVMICQGGPAATVREIAAGGRG